MRNQFAALTLSFMALVALAWVGLSQLAWRQAQGRITSDLHHIRRELEQRFGEMERLGLAVAGLWEEGVLDAGDGPNTWERLLPLVRPYQERLTGLNFVQTDGKAFGMTRLGSDWGGRTIHRESGTWVSGPILGDPQNLVRRDPARSRTALDFRTRDWYRLGASAQGPAWTEPYTFVGVMKGRPGLSLVLPIRRNGILVGVLSFDVLLETLTQALQDVKPTAGAFLGMLDARGNRLTPMGSGFGRLPAGVADDGTPPHTAGPRVSFRRDGRQLDGATLPFQRATGLDWRLYLAVPRREVASLALPHLLLVAALALVLLGFLAWQWRLLARKVGLPLSQLSQAAAALGRGEIPAPVQTPIAELQTLSHALTEAHGSLQERERLQDQLRQAQKLETVGTLAGGIAHDVNNQLTAILGQLELGLERVEPGHPTGRHMQRASEAARRCAETTRALLAFSRPSQPELVPMNLNEVVREALILLTRAIKGHVHLSDDVAPNLPMVLGDRVQMEQVLVNLVLNARDALPAGGTIVVGTRLGADGDVELFVQDNGVGMTPEVQSRIFEPFFTTKGPGSGTGLGLAMVKGLVDAHQGRITVTSAWGRGTTFTVALPPCSLSELSPPALIADEGTSNLRGLEILVAEDEPLIRDALVEWLESKGASVVAVEDGQLAWSRFQQQDFHAVISDHLMPGLTGLELVAHIRTLRSDLPVILVSGRGLEHVKESDPRLAILPKPYRLASLETMLQDLARVGE